MSLRKKKQKLILQQVSRKLAPFSNLLNIDVPSEGWIKAIRTALNMSLSQIAKKLGVKPSTVKNFETREKIGTITIKSMREIAEAMDMQFVYAIIPRDESLEDFVDRRISQKAQEIVNRASHTMKLENQENSKEWLISAYNEKKRELESEMPKYLWD